MRLNIARGARLLEREMTQLRRQMRRCASQAAKLSTFYPEGMEGTAALALGQRVSMQAAIAHAHLLFYQSLCDATRRHAALLQTLPTTSPGILDTSVAQQRKDEARKLKKDLERRKDEANRQRKAQEMESLMGFSGPPKRIEDRPYDRLIAQQEQTIAENTKIVERARDYVRQVSGIYAAVDTSLVQSATASALQFAQGCGWGDVGWIGQVSLGRSVQAQRVAESIGGETALWERFVRGELSQKGAAWQLGFEETLGIVGLLASVDVLGYEAKLAPYGKGSYDANKDKQSLALGTEASMALYAGHASFGVDLGFLQASNDTYVGRGDVTTSSGVSLPTNSTVLAAASKAKVEGSVMTSQTKGRLGTKDYNYHAKAKGSALTANAQAGLELDEEGLRAKLGTEAYAVTGEVSGGATFLGITFDTVIEGKVAGAGAVGGLAVGPSAIEGELGLGLGLGLGAKFKVSWAEAPAAIGRALDAVGTWWNQLFE